MTIVVQFYVKIDSIIVLQIILGHGFEVIQIRINFVAKCILSSLINYIVLLNSFLLECMPVLENDLLTQFWLKLT